MMMNVTTLLVLLATSVFAVSLGGVLILTNAADTSWGYAGDLGPSQWGKLSPEFAPCEEGKAQSPIDISDAAEVDLVDIEFHYGETERGLEANHSIYNNSHTIQVNVGDGSYIIYNGISYELAQFHFHSPSEHTINGEAAAMELHFVHIDHNSGALAVVGVLLVEGEGENKAYSNIFDNMPADVGEPETLAEPVDLKALLPKRRAYYTYQGSLTTPPCSEIVRWLLLDMPVALSRAQIEAYTALYTGNARPVQPLGKRDLLHSRR